MLLRGHRANSGPRRLQGGCGCSATAAGTGSTAAASATLLRPLKVALATSPVAKILEVACIVLYQYTQCVTW